MGWPAVQYADAARSNATVEDSVPGVPATGVDSLITTGPMTAPLLSLPSEVAAFVLCNWGVNEMGGGTDDVSALPDSTTWKANYRSILNYVHGLWPSATFVISYPWRGGYDLKAAEMHTRVDAIIAGCAADGYQCIPGVDEAVTIKDGDDGVLETDSGRVHYTNPYGVGLYATAMQHILGY